MFWFLIIARIVCQLLTRGRPVQSTDLKFFTLKIEIRYTNTRLEVILGCLVTRAFTLYTRSNWFLSPLGFKNVTILIQRCEKSGDSSQSWSQKLKFKWWELKVLNPHYQMKILGEKEIQWLPLTMKWMPCHLNEIDIQVVFLLLIERSENR